MQLGVVVLHSRLEVGVGGVASNCVGVHVLTLRHTRLLVGVTGADSYVSGSQSVAAAHTRLLAGAQGVTSYSIPGMHTVQLVQPLSPTAQVEETYA